MQDYYFHFSFCSGEELGARGKTLADVNQSSAMVQAVGVFCHGPLPEVSPMNINNLLQQ